MICRAVCFILFFISFFALAEQKVIEQKVKFNLAWQYEKDFMGFSHVWLADYQNNFRSNLSLTITGVKDLKFDLQTLHKEPQSYYQERQRWSQSRGFKFLDPIQPQLFNIQSSEQFFSIGFTYQKLDKVIQEMTYYGYCQGELIHLKSVSLKSETQQLKELQNAIKKMECLK